MIPPINAECWISSGSLGCWGCLLLCASSRAPTDLHLEIPLRNAGCKSCHHPSRSIKSFGNERWKIKIIHQSQLSSPVVFAAYLKGKVVILLAGCSLESGMLQLRLMLQERKPGASLSPFAKLFSPWGISLPCCSKDRIRDLHTGVIPAGAAGAQPSAWPHSSQCSQSMEGGKH